MTAFYNEIDPYAANWLRNLIAAGHIAPGVVDERSIVDIDPDELRQYRQCHFFAGIGGWSYALRLAGWPDDRPVWTGSCPCQPFSAAGKQRGSDDERHLWPAFHRLIRECRPPVVFGEQVAGAAGLAWLDHVLADLEDDSYAAAAAVVPACGVGAPHIRQRLWWMAHAEGARQSRRRCGEQAGRNGAICGSDVGIVGDAGRARLAQQRGERGAPRRQVGADAREAAFGTDASTAWDELEWLPCSDGKARPTQPGLFPLAHGVSGRVGRLRAYGNAIVPQVAAEFIAAAIA